MGHRRGYRCQGGESIANAAIGSVIGQIKPIIIGPIIRFFSSARYNLDAIAPVHIPAQMYSISIMIILMPQSPSPSSAAVILHVRSAGPCLQVVALSNRTATCRPRGPSLVRGRRAFDRNCATYYTYPGTGWRAFVR